MSVTKIVYTLLTKGFYKGDATKHLNEINKRLRPLFYEAGVLYDRSCCILKNNLNKFIFTEYSEEDNLEIKKVIEGIVLGEKVESIVIESLIVNNWIERTCNGFNLSPRSLIQYEDYILEIGGRFKKCVFCKQLVEDSDAHSFCKDVMHEII